MFGTLFHAESAVRIHHQRVVLNLHGVNLELDTQARVDLYLHHDAVLHKAQLRVFRIDGAGALLAAFQLVASVRSAEDLLFQCPIECGTAELEFDGARWCGATSGQKEGNIDQAPECCHKSICLGELLCWNL